MILSRLLLFCGLVAAAYSPAGAGRLEAGSFNTTSTFGNNSPTAVSFQQNFDTVPVVVALSDQQGGDAASIRITNISTSGFDALVLEPDNHDGPHIGQNVHFVAVEPGRHVFPDGSVIEAGRNSVLAVQHGSGVSGPVGWAGISFTSTRIGPPSVIAQIQTSNSERRNVPAQSSRPHITAILNGLSTTGFDVALERSQANSGPIPSSETIGWIAFPAASTGIFPDVNDNNITWSAVNTPTNIQGWQDGCFTNSFGQSSDSRIAVAKKITRNNDDGGWLRSCSISNTTLGLRVEEDRDQDNERRVAAADAESASIIAFSQAFHANLQPDISVLKTSLSFDDGHGTAFALPGGTLDYLITVQNSGNAPPNYDSLLITEALPANIGLIVTDFSGPGSGPILYQDGAQASGLSCAFSSFSSITDCYSFSSNGTDFNHIPSDSGDGTDPAITHIRIAPTGYMAADSGSGATSFTVRFKAKID